MNAGTLMPPDVLRAAVNEAVDCIVAEERRYIQDLFTEVESPVGELIKHGNYSAPAKDVVPSLVKMVEQTVAKPVSLDNLPIVKKPKSKTRKLQGERDESQ